jgi:hypothetical protein
MINRRVTRTILNTTETTAETGSIQGTPLTLAMTAADSFYIGFHGKFSARYFKMNTVNANSSVLTVEYWNGSSWAAVDDLIDQTSAGGKTLAQNGFVSWVNKTDWAKRSLTGIDSDVELYWVKLTVSADLSASTKVEGVMNLFSDDTLLRSYYPELVSNTGYLPSGRTDLFDQHVAAKDMVVLRLKQRKIIDDESQIIDINSVALAAVHACAFLILNPIATSESSQALRDAAFKAFSEEIGQLTLDIDKDKDGVISETERKASMSFVGVYRR